MILVTGGSGFLGSHVADMLSAKGFQVTIFDKNDRSWRNKKAKFIKGDISNSRLLESQIKKKAMEVVEFLNLAHLKNPKTHLRYSVKNHRVQFHNIYNQTPKFL